MVGYFIRRIAGSDISGHRLRSEYLHDAMRDTNHDAMRDTNHDAMRDTNHDAMRDRKILTHLLSGMLCDGLIFHNNVLCFEDIYIFFMHFCPGTMTTHAESINSDLQRGLDRRLRHTQQ